MRKGQEEEMEQGIYEEEYQVESMASMRYHFLPETDEILNHVDQNNVDQTYKLELISLARHVTLYFKHIFNQLYFYTFLSVRS